MAASTGVGAPGRLPEGHNRQYPAVFIPDKEGRPPQPNDPFGLYDMQKRDEAQGKDVLVVDDDPYLCEIMSDVLEGEGHIIRTASNGREALERIKERKPQIILLDLMMPIMSGWEVVAALRANAEWADIPVVIITANHQAQRKQEETGARAVLTKPFDIDQLTEVVEEYAA